FDSRIIGGSFYRALAISMLTSRRMGAALWVASALFVFFVARIVPPGRRQGYLLELVIALTAALLCGVIATALDFGGWREPDWRAAIFALLGALAAVGIYRSALLVRSG